MAKNLISDLILALLGQIRATNFFSSSKIWFRQSLDIIVSYHHVQYQKKPVIQSWENLVTDGRTNGRTDGQTDRPTDQLMSESDFRVRCPTNVDRPTSIAEFEQVSVIWEAHIFKVTFRKTVSHFSKRLEKFFFSIFEQTLKVHWCRFENLLVSLCSHKNNTLKILQS